MAKIPANVAKKINKDVAPILKNSVERRIFLAFERIKRETINEFLKHPVTKEIEAGPTAQNLSGTLDGYGNLFSYIGFYNGDDPISPITEVFEKSTIRFYRLIDGGVVWNVFIPAKEDIWDVSPMPWAAGRSWAKGIETGISGIGQYFYTIREDFGAVSRSETAIQTSKNIRRKTRFKNVKYISAILANFEKKINLLDETAIST